MPERILDRIEFSIANKNGHFSSHDQVAAATIDLFDQVINEETIHAYKLRRNDIAVGQLLIPALDPQFPSTITGAQLIEVLKAVNPGESYYWNSSIRTVFNKLAPLLAVHGLQIGRELDGQSFDRNTYWIEALQDTPTVASASMQLNEDDFMAPAEIADVADESDPMIALWQNYEREQELFNLLDRPMVDESFNEDQDPAVAWQETASTVESDGETDPYSYLNDMEKAILAAAQDTSPAKIIGLDRLYTHVFGTEHFLSDNVINLRKAIESLQQKLAMYQAPIAFINDPLGRRDWDFYVGTPESDKLIESTENTWQRYEETASTEILPIASGPVPIPQDYYDKLATAPIRRSLLDALKGSSADHIPSVGDLAIALYGIDTAARRGNVMAHIALLRQDIKAANVNLAIIANRSSGGGYYLGYRAENLTLKPNLPEKKLSQRPKEAGPGSKTRTETKQTHARYVSSHESSSSNNPSAASGMVEVFYDVPLLETKEQFRERLQKHAYQRSVIDLAERIFASFGINAGYNARIGEPAESMLPEVVSVLVLTLPEDQRDLLLATSTFKYDHQLLYKNLLRDAFYYAAEISRIPDKQLESRQFSIKQHYLMTLAAVMGRMLIKTEEEHMNEVLNRVFKDVSANDLAAGEREMATRLAKYFKGEYGLGTMKNVKIEDNDTPEDIEAKIEIAERNKWWAPRRHRQPSHGKQHL